MSKAENIVVGIFGHKGDFKTTTGVLFTWLENNMGTRKHLYSNIKLNIPNFDWLKGNDVVMLSKKLDDSIIFIDELQQYADCRTSSSLQNMRVSNFFLQSRHTKSNVYYTTQYKDQIDKRIQRITDIDIVSKNLFYDSDNDGDDDLFKITIIDKRGTGNIPVSKVLYAKPIWELFDSTDRVDPFVFEGEK